MTNPQNPGTPPPPRKRRTGLWIALAVVSALFVGCTAIGIAAVVGGSDISGQPATVATSSGPSPEAEAATSTPAPKPTAHAAGTAHGSCDYELATDISDYDAHAGDLNGEVDAANTGNVGIVMDVTITWPQLAHPAISMHRGVKVPAGQIRTVRFTKAVGGAVISRLQSWQEHHDFANGCTYDGRITGTYGPVQQ